MKLLAAVLLTAVMASAQSAKVVQLSPEDAAQAKQLDVDQKALSERASKFHDHIIRTYLVTMQGGRDGSIWPDPETKDAGGALTFWGVTNGGYLIASTQGYLAVGGEPRCETPEEKVARKAAEAKAKAEKAEFEKAHPTKYWKAGWGDSFEYSEGFKYIVPTNPPPSINSNVNSCPIVLTGN